MRLMHLNICDILTDFAPKVRIPKSKGDSKKIKRGPETMLFHCCKPTSLNKVSLQNLKPYQ